MALRGQAGESKRLARFTQTMPDFGFCAPIGAGSRRPTSCRSMQRWFPHFVGPLAAAAMLVCTPRLDAQSVTAHRAGPRRQVQAAIQSRRTDRRHESRLRVSIARGRSACAGSIVWWHGARARARSPPAVSGGTVPRRRGASASRSGASRRRIRGPARPLSHRQLGGHRDVGRAIDIRGREGCRNWCGHDAG
jgi:hypothetical protein